MLNYEYSPLGGGSSNACKYTIKEFEKKNSKVFDLKVSVITLQRGQYSTFFSYENKGNFDRIAIDKRNSPLSPRIT